MTTEDEQLYDELIQDYMCTDQQTERVHLAQEMNDVLEHEIE